MYTPAHFALTDPVALARLIDTHGFGLLCTVREGRIEASHLPLLLDAERMVLRGHMARANPQWQDFAVCQEVLAVFSGPHAYVSPAWYASPHAVPTWNYEAVHVYGKPRLSEDAQTRRLLEDLVDRYESGRVAPWTFPPGEEYAELLASMRRAIVAFEIDISRAEGKAKLSQNRDAADRVGVRERIAVENARFGAELAARMGELEGAEGDAAG